MLRQIVLVIAFGRIEALVVFDLRDDLAAIHMRLVELRDIRIGDLALRCVRREYGRAILRAVIGALIVQLRRIVRDRKEDLQQLAGRHLRIRTDSA